MKNCPEHSLWNLDNTDVLPSFQLTFGHALFRGIRSGEWRSTLFKVLDLGKPSYSGPLQSATLPRHAYDKCIVLSSPTEIHLIFARLDDVWCVFGPHDFFFSTTKWMNFNAKIGGLMGFATQMEADSFFYLIFSRGIKQTNVSGEKTEIRVIHDTPIAAYIVGKKILEDTAECSLSAAVIRDFIAHDLTIEVGHAEQLNLRQRFPNPTKVIEDVTHFVFQRGARKKRFLGIQW